MKLIGTVGAAIIISVLGATVPAYCEHGDRGDKQDKHENHSEHGSGKWEKHPGKQPERVVEQHREQRPEHRQQGNWHVQQHPEHRVVWEQRRAHEWASEHRNWQQRGGYHGYRIPHDRFIAYYGPQHRFRVHALPVLVVSGRPRFQYHGCWFTLVDPLPEYWAPSWYETDDVYVTYANDGYYMYNTRHPGVAISISASL